MALVTINEEYLEDIAEAIRSKSGTNETLRPKDMAAAINKLVTYIVEGEGDETFIIPAGRVKIEDYAYSYSNPSVEALPPQYTKISAAPDCFLQFLGVRSFADNPNIKEVDLSNCTYLKAMGDNTLDVTNAISFVFSGCTGLEEVTLPPNLVNLGSGTFNGCSRLTSIELPSTVRYIGQQAFRNTGLTSITIPVDTITVGNSNYGYTFAGCPNLLSVRFLGTPALINDTTFVGSDNLRYIMVPWSEGTLSGAPWGAPNATVYYNYTL